MRIRDFVPSDAPSLVEILKANQQYGHPELDGPEAMIRVHQCEAAEFLVAEEDYRIQPTTAVYSGGEKPRLARGVTGRITMRILEKRMAETLPRLLALAQALGLGRSRSIGFGEVTLRVHEPSP